jgi:hypothetical protein
MAEPTNGVWYDEIWFDNADWGTEAFADDDIFELLFMSPVAIVPASSTRRPALIGGKRTHVKHALTSRAQYIYSCADVG